MARRRLLLPAALAALLAGGCDFVDNLIEDKRLDKASLALSVEDALLGNGLKGAQCEAPGIPALLSNDAGGISWPEVPTGSYAVTCTAPGYYPRRLPVYMGAGKSRQDTLRLARRGDDWYPENPFAWPNIIFAKGIFRYPGRNVLSALPVDASRKGTFRYEWSCSLPKARLTKQDEVLTADMDSLPGLPDSVEFTLKVTAVLAETSYVIGTNTQVYPTQINASPRVDITAYRGSGAPLKVGCAENSVDVGVAATDPDGECKEIRVTTRIQDAPSFVPVDTVIECAPEKPLTLMVKTHTGLPDKVVSRNNTVTFTAMDDNGRTGATNISLTTESNLHPVIQIEQAAAQAKVFANVQQTFQVKAWDRDGKIYSVDVDWGDSTASTLSLLTDTLSWKFLHTFRKTGPHTVTAKVTDGCNGVHSANLPITVVENKPPTLALTSRGLAPSGKEFQIHVVANDAEVETGLDALKMLVDWGDGKQDSLVREPYQAIDTTLAHAYEPASPNPTFLIGVSVMDRQRNTAADTLRITREQAGLSAPP